MKHAHGRHQIWCARCGQYFLTDDNSGQIVPCPRCGTINRTVRCNRCGHSWELAAARYPKNCNICKSPYYNKTYCWVRKKGEQ